MPIQSVLRPTRSLSATATAPMRDVIDFFSDLVRMDPQFGAAPERSSPARSRAFNIRAAGQSLCVSLDDQGVLPPMVHRVARSA